MIRQATAQERAVWVADMPHEIRDQVMENWEQVFNDGLFVFLVDYREPNE